MRYLNLVEGSENDHIASHESAWLGAAKDVREAQKQQPLVASNITSVSSSSSSYPSTVAAATPSSKYFPSPSPSPIGFSFHPSSSHKPADFNSPSHSSKHSPDHSITQPNSLLSSTTIASSNSLPFSPSLLPVSLARFPAPTPSDQLIAAIIDGDTTRIR